MDYLNPQILPLELWSMIFDQLDFLSQIRLRQVNQYFYSFEIYDFYNIPYQYKFKYKFKLSDSILVHYKFIKFLDANYNPKITNINHMTNLKKLCAKGSCGINDNGIQNLNLIELNAHDNSKITNVNHMTNLKKLWANLDCGINDDGIK